MSTESPAPPSTVFEPSSVIAAPVASVPSPSPTSIPDAAPTPAERSPIEPILPSRNAPRVTVRRTQGVGQFSPAQSVPFGERGAQAAAELELIEPTTPFQVGYRNPGRRRPTVRKVTVDGGATRNEGVVNVPATMGEVATVIMTEPESLPVVAQSGELTFTTSPIESAQPVPAATELATQTLPVVTIPDGHDAMILVSPTKTSLIETPPTATLTSTSTGSGISLEGVQNNASEAAVISLDALSGPVEYTVKASDEKALVEEKKDSEENREALEESGKEVDESQDKKEVEWEVDESQDKKEAEKEEVVTENTEAEKKEEEEDTKSETTIKGETTEEV